MMERLIVLDPGHGGYAIAGGSSPNHATGPNGLMEKDVALDIAVRLGKLLWADSDVVLTRDTDRNLSLSARARIARDRRAAVFLSLHLGGDVSGVWISSPANAESRALAGRLLKSLSGLTGVRNLHERNLGVLLPSRHDAATAACLAEIAPLHHPEQARQLERDEYRDRIASALADALRDHLRPVSQSFDDQRRGPLPRREALEQLNRAAIDVMSRWESVLLAAERRVGLALIPRLPRRTMELLDADREVYEVGARAAAFKAHRKRMEALDGQDLVWLLDTAQSAIGQIEDATVRNRLLKQDWSKVVYVGKKGTTAPAVELFKEMARLTPERRVPSLIGYVNVESLVVKVPGTGYKLFPAARDAFVAARDAANDTHAKDETSGVLLVIGSAFRSEADQAKIAAGNTNRYAVAGNRSAHTYGLAVDLHLSVPGLAIAEISTASMPNIVSMYRSPAYKWMFLYGAEFGWFPYQNEPWHWEYNPPGFPEKFRALAKRPHS